MLKKLRQLMQNDDASLNDQVSLHRLAELEAQLAAAAEKIKVLTAKLETQSNQPHTSPDTIPSTPEIDIFCAASAPHDEWAQKLATGMMQMLTRAATTEVIGGVVHEINNPLQVIMGRTQIARMGEKQKESLEIIESQAMRIATITRGLQGFAQRSTKVRPVDITEIINGILDLVKTQFVKRNIQIEKSIETIPSFPGDPTIFQQIILSSLLGAKRRIGYNGSIRITARMGKKNGIFLEINDSAPMIDEQIKNDVEKSFLEALNSPSAELHLGLVASFQLVRHLGGRAMLNGIPPQGNQLSFSVPMKVHKDVTFHAQSVSNTYASAQEEQ